MPMSPPSVFFYLSFFLEPVQRHVCMSEGVFFLGVGFNGSVKMRYFPPFLYSTSWQTATCGKSSYADPPTIESWFTYADLPTIEPWLTYAGHFPRLLDAYPNIRENTETRGAYNSENETQHRKECVTPNIRMERILEWDVCIIDQVCLEYVMFEVPTYPFMF